MSEITGEAPRQRILTRGRAACATVVAAIMVVAVIGLAAPASAGTCSSKTGGSSDKLMWTGSTYTCAYVAASGNSSIGQGHTHTWTSSTAKSYVKRYNCQGQTGGVTVTYIYTNAANTGVGSSITYTAFNGSSGNRHWNAAVLWNTSQASVADNQFIHNCSTNYSIAVNSSYISKITMSGPSSITPGQQASYNVTVTAPDGGGTPTGTVALFRQASNSERSPVKKNCSNQVVSGNDVAIGSATLSNGSAIVKTPANLPAGTYQLYASYTGLPVTGEGLAAYCLTPPQSGLTPATLETSLKLTIGTSSSSAGLTVATSGHRTAQPRGDIAAPDPQLRVINRSIVTPMPLSIRCPKHYSA
ncbi:MAG: Ig-like domain-containing protein, partial [Actinomycetes bacterium]